MSATVAPQRISVPTTTVRAATDEPLGVKILLVGVSIAFLGLFLLVPLVAVFSEGLRKGLGTYWASLTDSKGGGIVVHSDGGQSTRSWIGKDGVRLLISKYDNAGAERFFRSHAAVDDKPLKIGDVVKDTVTLDLLKEKIK